YFTDAQYNQILNFLNKDFSDHQANMAGNVTCLMSNSNQREDEWIVDSGTTLHIASKLELLANTITTDKSNNDRVHLPTGGKADITHTGCACLLDKETVKNVLYVPDFRFNLLSVSKLTRALSCNVNFFPDFCVFQDLCNGRVKGIGGERG
ncbi:hypothetical protein A4A49_65848, partial [Nicotiana attenuata]